MLARFGRAAERARPLDHVRVADGPLVEVCPAPIDQPVAKRERLDPERGHELVLLLDLVVESDVREARGVVRRRRIGRRAREPVAQHVRDDDEVFGRVEGHAVSDQPLVVPVTPGVPGRVHDRVALVGVQVGRMSCMRAWRRAASRRAAASHRRDQRPRSPAGTHPSESHLLLVEKHLLEHHRRAWYLMDCR